MHRLLAVLLSFADALAGGWVVAEAGPATAQQVPSDDPRLGLIYEGLRKAPLDSLCAGAFEALIDARLPGSAREVLCTHGPDPAPEGVDVREDRGPDPAAELLAPAPGTAGETGAVACYGTGADGFRVQLVYAHSAGADRFATYAASFRAWAGRLDQVVRDSAAKTGGTRRVRFVTDPGCNPVVDRVTLTFGAMSNFTTMVSELHSLGYGRTDRKYLVWADTNVYCGISELYADDRHDPTPGRNYNNGHPSVPGTVGRVDNGCWGLSNMVEAHELLHLLGGVQKSAPHATSSFHCLDESDRLCYDDGSSSSPVRYVCPSQHEALYDCNSDDYFSTAAPPGSYLATHWNAANSAFLSAQAPVGAPTTTTTAPPPPPTTTTTPTTTTVAPPPPPTTTTTVAPPPVTTTAPPETTTTVAPQTTTTSPPVGGAAPSAPRALSARQPSVGTGVVLSWEPPATGRVSGYRIFRGTSPYDQTALVTVRNMLGYHDATAGNAMYFYRVTAFNDAGEGPPSTVAGMIGRTASAAGVAREDGRRVVVPNPQLRSAWGTRWA